MMRIFLDLSVAVFSMVLTTLAGAATAQVVGHAVAVTPQAQLLTGHISSTLSVGKGVSKGDVIQTGPNGSVQLLFNDETRIVVGPGSQLVIDDIVMRQSDRASRFAVNALGGTFRFLSGKSNKSAYRIATPTATMGIRGTIFDFYVLQDRLTNVVIFEGEVELCPRRGSCRSIASRCSMSETNNRRTNVFVFGRSDRNQRLRENFPYVVDQDPLRSEFRAPVDSCGNIRKIEEKRKKKEPQPKPPEDPN